MKDSVDNPAEVRLAAVLAACAADRLAVSAGVSLSDCGTFRLGGPCGLLVDCATPEEVVCAARRVRESDVPAVFIGGGSNLLFSDRGYGGVVIRHLSPVPHIRSDGALLEVDAGTVLDDLAAHAVEHGLAGLECLSGIPGTVGGAVAGNAGAWGRQIGDAVERVRLLCEDGSVIEVPGSGMEFAYRSSRLQRSGEHLLACWLRAPAGDREEQRAERARILALRAEKHPDVRVDPCIGSIFRNLEPTSRAERRQAAGHLLEQAGAREMRVGGAVLFPKHANIIVRGEGCSAQDVRDLIVRMRDAVKARFDVELRREVRYLGRFDGETPHPGFF